MKNSRLLYCFCLSVVMLMSGSCVNIDEPDYQERDYGYVQFKLYKAASYVPVRSSAEEEQGKVLSYLADATKVRVKVSDGRQTLDQTLVLNSYNEDSAEYGLRSDKMKLLAGSYNVISYSLFGKLDELIYESSPADSPLMESSFTVVPGGLCMHDLLANTVKRGKVRFALVKDTSEFVQTRANQRDREYTFDEIKAMDIQLRDGDDHVFRFTALPVKFSTHFVDNDDPEDGMYTSSSVCDTVLSLPAGEYSIDNYVVYDDKKGKSLLERNENVKATIKIEDNVLSEAKVPVRLYQSDLYIQDYYALKAIWEALDGPRWY